MQTSIFAPLFNRKHISLDYGVMVAQQVLVLFVQVRILVVQRRKGGCVKTLAQPLLYFTVLLYFLLAMLLFPGAADFSGWQAFL